MSVKIQFDGAEYSYAEIMELCRNWNSLPAKQSAVEVFQLLLATIDNLRADYIFSDPTTLQEFAGLFSNEELAFLTQIVEESKL